MNRAGSEDPMAEATDARSRGAVPPATTSQPGQPPIIVTDPAAASPFAPAQATVEGHAASGSGADAVPGTKPQPSPGPGRPTEPGVQQAAAPEAVAPPEPAPNVHPYIQPNGASSADVDASPATTPGAKRQRLPRDSRSEPFPDPELAPGYAAAAAAAAEAEAAVAAADVAKLEAVAAVVSGERAEHVRGSASDDGMVDDGASGASSPTDAGSAPPLRDVVLRIEFCSKLEVKALAWLVVGVVLFGVAMTVALKVVASLRNSSWYVLDAGGTMFRTNRIVGLVCIGVTAALWLLYVGRGLLGLLRRLRWDHRRSRTYWLRLAELSVIAVRFCCWVAANDESLLRDDCPRFQRILIATYLVRGTMDNTLLCIWLITARGSTLWRNRMQALTLLQRLALGAWGCLRCCLVGGRGGAAAVGQLAVLGGKGAARELGLRAKQVGGLAASLVQGQRPGRAAALQAAASGKQQQQGPQAQVQGAKAAAPAVAVMTATAGLGPEREVGMPAAPPLPRPAPALGLEALSAASCPAEALGPGLIPAGAQPGPDGLGSASVPGPPEGPPRALSNEAVHAAAEAAQAAASLEEVLFIDAGWFAFTAGPLAWLWLPFQAIIVANTILLTRLAQGRTEPAACQAYYSSCREMTSGSFILQCLLLGAEVGYVLVYFGYCLKAFAYLRSRSYVLCRQLNIYLSVEVRIRGTVLLFLVANDFVQVFVAPMVDTPSGPKHCRYALDSMLGVWSAQIVAVTLVCSLAWLFSPRSVGAGLPVLQATLQRFAWTESGLPRALEHRLASLPPHTSARNRERLEREPMFCFETSLKLCYWCEHAYYFEEPGCAMRLPLEQLLGLYELDSVEVIREEESDSKAMLAASGHTALVCFRGTASLKAACVDLKAVLVPYHDRGAFQHPLAPLAAVHQGFQWSWLHNGFRDRVMGWLAAYRDAHPEATIIITGHSLGGAHATLCTLDLVQTEAARAAVGTGPPLRPEQVRCYTYGAPRVGNASFATMYDKYVYETWNVINGNDVVPLSPKYVGWFVYKHPGHKVIAKRRGDLIVRPTFTENSVARLPCSRSVRHHLLGSYIRSMVAVLRMQTHGKHVEGGVRGLIHMSRYNLPELDRVLAELVAEVQAVALAAVEAVEHVNLQHMQAAGGPGAPTAAAGSSSRGLGGAEASAGPAAAGAGRGSGRVVSGRPSEATLAAAATGAAVLAERGGAAVLAALGKHGSVRLLMSQELRLSMLAPAAAEAPGPAPAPGRPSTEGPGGGAGALGVDNDDLRSTRQVLRRLVQRLNLGMELLGLETGFGEDEDGSGLGAGAAAGRYGAASAAPSQSQPHAPGPGLRPGSIAAEPAPALPSAVFRPGSVSAGSAVGGRFGSAAAAAAAEQGDAELAAFQLALARQDHARSEYRRKHWRRVMGRGRGQGRGGEGGGSGARVRRASTGALEGAQPSPEAHSAVSVATAAAASVHRSLGQGPRFMSHRHAHREPTPGPQQPGASSRRRVHAVRRDGTGRVDQADSDAGPSGAAHLPVSPSSTEPWARAAQVDLTVRENPGLAGAGPGPVGEGVEPEGFGGWNFVERGGGSSAEAPVPHWGWWGGRWWGPNYEVHAAGALAALAVAAGSGAGAEQAVRRECAAARRAVLVRRLLQGVEGEGRWADMFESGVSPDVEAALPR